MRPAVLSAVVILAACDASSEGAFDGALQDAAQLDAAFQDAAPVDDASTGPDAAPGCGNGVVTPGDLCIAGQAWTTFATGERSVDLAVADVTGDGRADIVTVNPQPTTLGNDVSRLVGNGDGTFGQATFLATGSSGAAAVAIADIDHALGVDLIVGDDPGVVLFHGLGNRGFDAGTRIRSAGNPFDIAAVDIDGDGDVDVVLADGQSEDVIVLDNTSGIFAMTARQDTATIPNRLAIADVTGDSILDVLSADSQPTYTGGVSLYAGARVSAS